MAPLAPELTLDIRRKVFPAVGNRDEILVLRDVSVAIEPRSFVVITTAVGLRQVDDAQHHRRARPRFRGQGPVPRPRQPARLVFQTPRLLPWRTVAENIALVFKSGDPRIAQIPEMLTRVGLSGAEHAYPERLSLGMQRRVALARAFILEPTSCSWTSPSSRLTIRPRLAAPAPHRAVDAPADDGALRHPRPLRGGDARHPNLASVGGSATVAQDAAVTPSPGDRLCPEKVRASSGGSGET